MLSKSGKAIPVTEDQKPDRKDEGVRGEGHQLGMHGRTHMSFKVVSNPFRPCVKTHEYTQE